MKPTYTVDSEILKLLSLVAEKIGALSTNNFIKQNPNFLELSTATASRDLKKGVELQLFKIVGNKNQSRYHYNKY